MGRLSHTDKNRAARMVGEMKGKKILGLASGGGQQIPVFTALGADCTVLDYSAEQLKREEEVGKRGGLYSKVRPRRYDKAPAVCGREL